VGLLLVGLSSVGLIQKLEAGAIVTLAGFQAPLYAGAHQDFRTIRAELSANRDGKSGFERRYERNTDAIFGTIH
jgi:hypothetical protein